MNNYYFIELVREFSSLKEVEAIALAGSRANNQNDLFSDFDVYIYTNEMIGIEQRKIITDKYTNYMELGNSYWELEDDGILKCGTAIDIIYRRLEDIETILERVVIEKQASIGYSTCFWFNILNSQILFDRNGLLQNLVKSYSIEYKNELRENIIRLNYPLLKKSIVAYYHQIEKAIKRNDLVSINHRIAAFLASYFDIIFALNKVLHPGEKRLVPFAMAHCEILPKAFKENIDSLLMQSGSHIQEVVSVLDKIINNLEEIIREYL